MKILVLDPRHGDSFADLYLVDAADGTSRMLRLGYVPEVLYDAAARELVVVDTELGQSPSAATRYWLKCFDADSLRLTRQKAIPVRPMYAGFPGRSHHVMATPSGRYLYVFQAEILFRYPREENTFRLTLHRYERESNRLEGGGPIIESCMLDCGTLGQSDDELYFHLSCDFPSTVAFGSFSSRELRWTRLEDLPCRAHSSRETCGSWADREKAALFCVTGQAKIFELRYPALQPALLMQLPVTGSRSVPLHHLYGGGGWLFVGIARDEEERSVGLASEIWQVSIADAAVVRVIQLPLPAMNFVTSADGELLVGTNPYAHVLFLLETASGQVCNGLKDLGLSPAEVLLAP